MNWTDFFTTIILLYLLWYCFNLIRDFALTRGLGKARSGFQNYNIQNLIAEEENVVPVREEDFSTNDPRKDQMNPTTNLKDTQPQENQFITFKEPPENQGIPLQEFLKMARDKAVQSANKIQYS